MGDWVKPLFNRYDPYVIKGKLDEYITNELTTAHKCKQTFEYSNVKLALGLIATGFTVIAHVYEYIFDAHFPKDYNITVVGVIGYFLFNFIYQIFENYYEKEVFFTGNPGITGVTSIDISSTIKKCDEFYTLQVFTYFNDNKVRMSSYKHSVGKFFYEDGYMAKAAVQKAVSEIIKDLKKKAS